MQSHHKSAMQLSHVALSGTVGSKACDTAQLHACAQQGALTKECQTQPMHAWIFTLKVQCASMSCPQHISTAHPHSTSPQHNSILEVSLHLQMHPKRERSHHPVQPSDKDQGTNTVCTTAVSTVCSTGCQHMRIKAGSSTVEFPGSMAPC